MDNVKELIEAAQFDSSSLKQIEEYVEYLVDIFDEKGDFRRTKVFREIEQIFLACPQSLPISKEYSSILVLLEGADKGKRGIETCHIVESIVNRFPEDESIAENYASILVRCSSEYDSVKWKNVVETISNIQHKFPDNEEIKNSLVEAQEILEETLIYEKASKEVSKYKSELEADPHSIDLIHKYVDALSLYSCYVDEEEGYAIRETVLSYFDAYDDSFIFYQKYIPILLSLIENVDGAETEKIRLEIKSIYKKNPNELFAELYSDALSSVSGNEDDYRVNAVEDLKLLRDRFPDNERIIANYLYGLSTLIDDQSDEVAIDTLKKIFSIAESYPDSSVIQARLSDAKWTFKLYHEDAVFWDDSVYPDNCFAVIDVETNFEDRIMTIGLVFADAETYLPFDFKYYIISPEYKVGGMFSSKIELEAGNITKKSIRSDAIKDICGYLTKYSVDYIFSYNLSFENSIIPELADYYWLDIMPLALNRKYNKFIPSNTQCYKNGSLKHRYGIESILKMMCNEIHYYQTHNALFDAIDELKLLQYLQYSLESYLYMNYSLESFVPIPMYTPVKNDNCVKPNEIKRDFLVGDRVYHPSFGDGLIIQIQEWIGKGWKHIKDPTILFIGEGTHVISGEGNYFYRIV